MNIHGSEHLHVTVISVTLLASFNFMKYQWAAINSFSLRDQKIVYLKPGFKRESCKMSLQDFCIWTKVIQLNAYLPESSSLGWLKKHKPFRKTLLLSLTATLTNVCYINKVYQQIATTNIRHHADLPRLNLVFVTGLEFKTMPFLQF